MAVTFQRTFRVRHYECDGYGHLNNVNYVRYMQETALDASAAVGWNQARYVQIGCSWLIRETEIEYLHPVRYNDDVTLTTWVANFRRVQSLRRYTFHDANTRQIIAKASTNWVFLENDTLRPARIPGEMMTAFIPDGEISHESGEPFPESTPPPGAFQMQRRVEWRDIDGVGHVNNASYFAYCEAASTEVGRHFGWSMPIMQSQGLAMVLRRFRIQYLQAAQMDDEIHLTTWLSDARRASATRHYLLRRVSDGEILARAYGVWVCFDLDRQRPARFPTQMVEAFAPNLANT
ncbi:MAG: acyl-CoA thioesterase [Anaerolineae bacterium]|nr:acyl-CoA thioesterase [Anaerolineae bacterium]